MVLTSYETFRELRLAGSAERDVAKTLQASARTLLPAAEPDGRKGERRRD